MERRTEILAIEDDLGDVEILRRYMNDIPGFALDTAESLSQGLEFVAGKSFDLVLLDLGLPDSQGVQTIIRFRSEAPRVPVVVLTGQQDETLGTEAVRLGAQDFLSKADINQALLSKAIGYALERHRSLEALESQRQQLLSVFDGIGEVIYVSDPHTHEILFMNQYGKELLGKDPIGCKCYVELQGLESPCTFCTNEIIMRNKNEPHEWEFYNPILDGWYHITDQIITWSDGRHVRLEVAIDITESKNTEDRLKEQTKFLSALMDAIPVPVFYKDLNLIYRGCNREFEGFHGRSRDEIIGRTAFDITSTETADIFKEQDIELLSNPSPRIYETSVLRSDGSMRNIIVHKASFNDSEGNLAGIIGAFMDVTEQQSIERQLRKAQKMESIATLAGGVAHDFNNLLTIITGYAELGLISLKEGDPGYEELGTILNAVGRGADLVRQILTFSREVETKPKPINLNHQVEHAKKLLYKTIPKMIRIETHLADDLKVVNADPTLMEQVLINLGVNARDAMPEGGRLIFQTENVFLDKQYCDHHVEAQPGSHVLLIISDTGKGMEQEVVDRIFEPFFSTKKPGEGTGLGLAMVFGIVKSHGGHVSCHSEPRVGTTFKLYFPVHEAVLNPDLSTTIEMEAFGTETILLVDDEELIRDLGKQILSQRGFTVLTASNGHEALDIYRGNRSGISLVILDLIMPEMGGRECLDELLKIDPNIKVLVSSGYMSNGLTRETVAEKAAGFIDKPFKAKRMLKIVRKVLDET